MRILLVADVVGGVRSFTRTLAGELAGRGVEVHLALLGDPADAAELASLPVASCEVRPLALEWMEAPWEDVARAAEWVAGLCRRHRPELIHANTFTPLPDPGPPVLLTVHSCVLSWWRAVHGVPAPPEWERYRRLASRALDRAAGLVTPTRALLADLAEIYGDLPPARVVSNGSHVAEVNTEDAPPPEPLVLTAGRIWDEAKNVALLCRAAPAIRGRVAVIGPRGSSGPAQDAPGWAEVDHRGPLPHHDVLEELRRAAVFAEPARYEPFGLAALEAARCDCALVLGDIASLREVWGDAAAYVHPDDPEALAAAANALLADPERRDAAGREARRRAARYTPAAMAEGYLAAYESARASSLSAA